MKLYILLKYGEIYSIFEKYFIGIFSLFVQANIKGNIINIITAIRNKKKINIEFIILYLITFL